MADSRKYYYLKLKETYFDDDAVVLLESMPGGEVYSNMLLKLYLKSLKSKGKLQLADGIPYTTQMLATVTHQRPETVEEAIKLFIYLGLAEPLPDGTLYMSNIELLVGKSSTEGERKRMARQNLGVDKQLPDKCPPYSPDICPPYSPDKCPPEIEKEIEIKQEREKEPAPGLGRFENVYLSEKELAILQKELPQKWQYYIDRLSAHMASTGRQYRKHLATILKWSQEDGGQKNAPNYTYQEGESL